ncbi:MAG TPA: class I SAM-dependent methyltransferase [Vicinamibacterales bacterium]|nr:class I SAM-dependent methyltransferase [Vicinamibacterales bacterium]
MGGCTGRALWDAHALADPLWAVLSDPEKKGRRWTLQEFMKNGEREIALLFHRLARLQQAIPEGPVLDFGCGVGRLTQALARRRDQVVGADVSPVMVQIADRLNRYPERARYVSTADSGLDALPVQDFALIYSNIVLQHVAPDLSRSYLREFFRRLRPGGLLVFQLPSHRRSASQLEITPMSDAAYRASLELAGPRPASAAAASDVAVLLRVRNISGHTWSQPASGPMAVGNHWFDATGQRMLQQDDARAPLLQVVEPDQSWPVLITVHAPGEPGKYVAEMDLVHEGSTWFAHKGSHTLRFPLEVTAAAGAVASAVVMEELPVPDYSDAGLPAAPRAGAADPEPFGMHGVPHEEVLALIQEHGGALIDLEEDGRAGPGWLSYRYFVKGP